MEINNVINLLNSGKLPQGSKSKLFDNQGFNKLVQSLQAVKDGNTNEITIQGSKELADIMYGLLNADRSSESINTVSEKKKASPGKLFIKDLLTENEDISAETKDNKKKNEISLLQNVILNFINESLVKPQNINLVNSISQNDNAANSKTNVLSHEIVQQFLFDKQNDKISDSATSNVINKIALKSSNILELNNLEQTKQGEGLQSAQQFQGLTNEVNTPMQVERPKDDRNGLNILQSRKFALGLDENIVYDFSNFKYASENGAYDNANLVGNVQKEMAGQKQTRNRDILNEIVKMANAEQLSTKETPNGTKVETVQAKDNGSSNSTSEVLSWYIDKLNGKIPRISQTGTNKPYIVIDPPIRDVSLPEISEEKLEASPKQKPENRIEQKVQPGPFKLEESFMKMPEDRVKVKMQEFMGNVKAQVSNADEKNLDRVASVNNIPKLTSEINKSKDLEKYTETKLEPADVKLETTANNELIDRTVEEKYSVNVKLETEPKHNLNGSVKDAKSQEILVRSTVDKQEIAETKPETIIRNVLKDLTAINKETVDVNPDTNINDRLGGKIQDYNKEAMTKYKVEGFEENGPNGRAAVNRNYVIASIQEKSLANSSVTNASLNDIKNNKNVSEIMSNNSQMDKHEFKSQNKVKNDFSRENRFLRDILAGSKEGKSKENLGNNLSSFTTQLNSIKGNEVTNKSNEPMIHRDSITGDLLKSVKYIEAQNIKELTVKVAPKELGELTIRLTVENGIMKANITTNNESTLHIINSHLPEINQKLVDQNMQIQSFSVGISNNDMSYFNQNSQGNSGQQQNPQKTVYNYDNQENDLGNEDVTLNTNNVDVLA